MLFDCLTINVGSMGTILGRLTSAIEEVFSTLSITKIEKDANTGQEREISQSSTEEPTLARAVTPGQYRTCLENRGRAELILYAGYVLNYD